MSTKQDIELHSGENWKISFAAHYADGTTMPLGSGAEVEFRISDEDGNEVLTQSITGGGIVVTDEPNGLAEITVTAEEQEASGIEITSAGAYSYEIRVTKESEVYIQAEGRLKVAHSLFAAIVDPLVVEFHVRFPEFTEDDGIISLYMRDATVTVDDAGVSWSDADRTLAIEYLAAHLLQMRLNAKLLHEAGGLETGPVRMIRVEDRSVSYGDPTTNLTKAGFNQSHYGQHYLMLLRKYPRWLMRA